MFNFIRNKKNFFLLGSMLVLIFLHLFWFQQKEKCIERYWELVKWNSGTMQVIACSATSIENLEKITNTAWQEVERLDSVINEYDPISEAGKLRLALENGVSSMAISFELWQLLQFSQTISQRTQGVFDITVGPLVKLWKKCGELNRLPTQEEFLKIQSQIGWDRLHLVEPQKVELHGSDPLSINLGAFSKGYAVDQVVGVLQRQGIANGLVRMGGDIRCFGDRVWKVGIQDPRIKNADDPESIIGIVKVQNKAVSTSGHYRRYIEIQGHRYSHIINIKNLKPVETVIISVTVIGPTNMISDAYCTSFCLLPISESLKIAQEIGLEVCIITQETDGYLLHITPGFEQYWYEKPNMKKE